MAELAAYFDALADGWDARYRRSRFFRARYGALARLLAQHAAPGGGALDYGCGAGTFLGLLADRAGRAVGTDLSDAMRRAAAARWAGRDDVAVVEIEAALAGRYATVLCSSVVEYVDDDAALAGRLAGVLAPGGRLVVSFPARWGAMQVAQRALARVRGGGGYLAHQKHTYTRADVRRVLGGAGLRVVSLEGVSGVPGAVAVGLGEITVAVAEAP